MQRTRAILSSIGSLGVFGLILLLITAIVLLTWITIGAAKRPTVHIQDELTLLTRLEDQVSYYLLEMDINADYYDFSGGDEFYREDYQESSALILETLDELESKLGGFTPEESGHYENLLDAIQAHNQAFEDLQIAVGGSAVAGGDYSELEALQIELAEYTALAQKSIRDWTFEVEARRSQAGEQQNRMVLVAIISGALGLVATPLLAYWAFGQAGNLTRPILAITDSLVAIQGGRLRPEALAEAAGRNDNLGELAREIKAMQNQIVARRQALVAELSDLQAQLREERRRKRI